MSLELGHFVRSACLIIIMTDTFTVYNGGRKARQFASELTTSPRYIEMLRLLLLGASSTDLESELMRLPRCVVAWLATHKRECEIFNQVVRPGAPERSRYQTLIKKTINRYHLR